MNDNFGHKNIFVLDFLSLSHSLSLAEYEKKKYPKIENRFLQRDHSVNFRRGESCRFKILFFPIKVVACYKYSVYNNMIGSLKD